jgi:nucleoside-diphosphate-sugar epimerase
MRVFLTGATGYIGSAVCDALVRAGHDVSVLARPSARSRRLQRPRVSVLTGDLVDIASNRSALEGFDAYVLTAFDSSARGAATDREVIETIRDIAWRSGGTSVVYTSGMWVLGTTREPADESAALHPPDHVAFRPAHEQLVLESNGGGVRGIVVRPGIVYGGSRGLVSEMLRDAENGIVRVIGSGDNHWPLVYDRDLGDLYARLVANESSSGIYHANDEGDERVNDLVDAISPYLPVRPDVRHVPIDEARAQMGPYADALALDQRVRSPRARALGWMPMLRSVTGNAARLLEEWRGQRLGTAYV